MRRGGLLVLLVLTALAGCSAQQQAGMRSELTRRDIYLNLMTPEQAAKFRLMEADQIDDEHKVLYCQEIGVYQKWRAVPPEMQNTIRKGRIAEGLSPDEVQMAWGPPVEVEEVTTPAERQESHKKTLWKFDPAGTRDGEVSYRREVCFLDEKVLWFKDFRDKPAWNWNWYKTR